MQQLRQWKIKKITALELANQAQALVIKYNQLWDQEDIDVMVKEFFAMLEDSRLIETILGADRICYRFEYLNQYFIIQFETYTSSCWVESEDSSGNQTLSKLEQAISVNI